MADQGALFFTDQYGRQQVTKPYPWGPGARATDTSVEAAEAIAPKVDTLRERALETIRAAADGLTADEVAAALGESVLAIRPRICELAKLGHIQDTTGRRPNVSGKSAIVWRCA